MDKRAGKKEDKNKPMESDKRMIKKKGESEVKGSPVSQDVTIDISSDNENSGKKRKKGEGELSEKKLMEELCRGYPDLDRM